MQRTEELQSQRLAMWIRTPGLPWAVVLDGLFTGSDCSFCFCEMGWEGVTIGAVGQMRDGSTLHWTQTAGRAADAAAGNSNDVRGGCRGQVEVWDPQCGGTPHSLCTWP